MVNKDEYNYPSDRYWNICIDGYNNNNIGTSQLDIAYSNIKI